MVISYIRFLGSVGYTLNFDTVTMKFDKISHNYSNTGTLKVVLWATQDYTGGTSWTGTRMGEYRLESINDTQCYMDKNLTVSRTSPNPGSCTIVIALETYNGKEFTMSDHVAFAGKAQICAEAKFVGSIGYTCKEEEEVTLRADRISHNFGGGTGSLKMVLWACSSPAQNGTWTGFEIAEKQFEPLKPGQYYEKIDQTVALAYPSRGEYYTIMELESYGANGWVKENFVQFDGLSSF